MNDPAFSSPTVLWATLFQQQRSSGLTLQGRIRQMLVSAILTGHLPPGAPVPSSRRLSENLNIARNTVVFAYQQLVCEGYLISRERSGHYVADDVFNGHLAAHNVVANPDPAPAAAPGAQCSPSWPQRLAFLPSRQRNVSKSANWQRLPYSFVYGQFDANRFPTAEWRECSTRALSVLGIKSWAPDLIASDDPALVDAIRTQVLPSRGIWAQKDEIIITVGAQHALYLLADLLMHRHTVIGMEDPGYPDARNIFAHRSDQVRPLAVDAQGLCMTPDLHQCDYIFVTPNHQCPTGAILALERRTALLSLACKFDSIIIEDDYETDSPYSTPPVAALKSLDRDGRVIYVGSLSKSFAPGLRLGYILAPPALAPELRALRRLMLRHPCAYVQRAFALFISLGHHHALLRRQSELYAQRALCLAQALRTHLPEFQLNPMYGGSSCWLKAPPGVDVQRLAIAALQEGVVIEPGQAFFHRPDAAAGYMRLGFSSIGIDKIPAGIERLARAYKGLGDFGACR